MVRRIVISGCSGGGKSTLLDALARRGETIVAEPGRRIVAEETANGGGALPWTDAAAFARRAIALSLTDLAAVDPDANRVFFDRGLIDAAAALDHLTGEAAMDKLLAGHRFHPQAFFAPPWPEIYRTDDGRRHGFEEAAAEYDRLTFAYRTLGYDIVLLPKASVADRVGFLLSRLDLT